MKRLIFALSAISLLAGPAPALAAKQCRDKHGKFIKCPEAKPKQCRDAHGKFVKCK